MARGRLRKMALVVAALVAVVIGAGAWFLRVEDIPAELPPVQGDPLAIEIPVVEGAQSMPMPPLRLRDLAGKTAFFVVVVPQTGDSKEGQALNRALNRWIYPGTTVGFILGDAEGFGMFRGKIAQMLQHFGAEMRYPLYVDFEGVFVATFGLAKGHHGFVVLGPDGTVLERRSGGAEGAELERIRELLGAREPDVGPPMPEFTAGTLHHTDCGGGTPCALLFLDRPVARADVPGIEDGFEGEDEAQYERMRQPAVRIVATALRGELARARGVIVGRTSELEFPTWIRVDDAPEARAAFGIRADESAVVVIDAEGRVAMVERGAVPLYKWGRVSDLLGVELNDRKPAKK